MNERSREIPSLPAADVASFVRDFLTPEQPVLLRGVPVGATVGAPEPSRLLRELNARIAGDPGSSLQELCWEVRPALLSGLCETPAAVAAALDPRAAFVRERHVRLWFDAKGHRTLWHYDGHSLHVFNLQVEGRKRWRIVAPETPLVCLPFTSVGMFGDYRLEGRRSYEFETGPGDLLFLPRHWCHSVRSLAERNVNVNWVLTPRAPALDNPSARREAELTWLKSKLRPLLPRRVRAYNEHYAGAGPVALASITRGVGLGAAARRLLLELLKLPCLPFALWSLRPGLAAVRASTRRLRGLVREAAEPGSDATGAGATRRA